VERKVVLSHGEEETCEEGQEDRVLALLPWFANREENGNGGLLGKEGGEEDGGGGGGRR
jgi:hypothetical protein